MQPDWVKQLSSMKLAPYICKARALIGVPRIGGDNMFRHQMMTLTVLLDYLVIDSIFGAELTLSDGIKVNSHLASFDPTARLEGLRYQGGLYTITKDGVQKQKG